MIVSPGGERSVHCQTESSSRSGQLDSLELLTPEKCDFNVNDNNADNVSEWSEDAYESEAGKSVVVQ